MHASVTDASYIIPVSGRDWDGLPATGDGLPATGAL